MIPASACKECSCAAFYHLVCKPRADDAKITVGGYIEAVLYTDGFVVYANEDGLRMQLPPNPKASGFVAAMCEALERPLPRGADNLVGNIVIVGHDGSPENVAIPDKWVERFKEMDLWV